jgi:DNA polymerase-3 subunit delta'
LHGAPGVGKQRIALWLGQLLLCSNSDNDGPCGSCKSCRLASTLEHPDLHWYFPLPRPKGVSRPEKLREALEAARHEAIGEVRADPLRPSVSSSDPTGLYLAVAQNLRARAQKRPSMGERQVFVIGEAETLVPQEASQEAANALLKLLEEPPPGTTLVLTSNEPGRLLATIRSRALSVYVPPVADEEVDRFLREIAGVDTGEAEKAVRQARGSIGRALGFLPDGDEPGALEALRQDAFRLVKAATARSRGSAYAHGLSVAPSRARALGPLLGFVEEVLRDLAATLAGAEAEVRSRDAAKFFDRLAKDAGVHPTAVARALALVDEAKEMAAGNVNPQLVLGGLALDLRRTLLGTPRDRRAAS